MRLFGDVNIGGDPSSSTSEEGSDVTSVSSNLHVSLDDVKKSNEKPRGHRKSATKKSNGSMGSMTRSELFRLNLEIKKMENEQENKKMESEQANKKMEQETERLKIERKFELKKLELG